MRGVNGTILKRQLDAQVPPRLRRRPSPQSGSLERWRTGIPHCVGPVARQENEGSKSTHLITAQGNREEMGYHPPTNNLKTSD